MKFFVIFFVVITAVACMPSENSEKSVFPNSDLLRITSGLPANESETTDVCNIYSYYISKTQQCAGTLVDSKWVLTSCRCAFDLQEDEAKSIYVKCGKSKDFKKSKLVVFPNGKNGATMAKVKTLDLYDYTKDTKFSILPESCLAMIQLTSPYNATDISTKLVEKAIITTKTTLSDALTAFPEARYCGFGSIDNDGNLPKTVLCAETNLVDKTTCKASNELKPYAAPAANFIPDTAGCVLPVANANICRGDIGAPVYGISRNADSTIKERNLLGIVGGSVTYISCGDNHVPTVTALPGKAAEWVAGVIAGYTV